MNRQEITLNVGSREARVYLARPEGAGGGPGLLLLHAWWGLNPFFKSLCERYAEAGFVALAPDLFDGQTATTIDEAERLSQSGDEGPTPQIVRAAADYLLALPGRTGAKIGVVGHSFGAWYAGQLAEELPEAVGAVVFYYGAVDPGFDESQAAYLAHFGEQDEWEPQESIQEMEQALRAAGRETTIHVYPRAGHWFVEEDRPDAFNAAAAELAWQRTIAFLRQELS